MTEAEKRLRRCCFTGHRPEKLRADEAHVKAALFKAIHSAYEAGFRTFITGMARGVDIWAGELVLELRSKHDDVRLICALPHLDFEKSWRPEWQERYNKLLVSADLLRTISTDYCKAAYQKRNEWMVDHSALVLAIYNGEAGGTRNTIQYAKRRGIDVKIIEV